MSRLGRNIVNDCIATQIICQTPEILIASPVISRTTSEPSGGRARMMVAIVAGCHGVCTFRDCHIALNYYGIRLLFMIRIFYSVTMC